MLFFALLLVIQGCTEYVNCEKHINEKIRPMYIRGTITEIDELHRPIIIHYQTPKGFYKISFVQTCEEVDDSNYLNPRRMSIRDSIIKNIDTDTFLIKRESGQVLSIKYQCCVK